MAKRGLYYDLVRQQEKHGKNEDTLPIHRPSTADSQYASTTSNASSTSSNFNTQQRPNMTQG